MSSEQVCITITKWDDSKKWEYSVAIHPHFITKGSVPSMEKAIERAKVWLTELQRIAALEKKTNKSRRVLQRERRKYEHRLADQHNRTKR